MLGISAQFRVRFSVILGMSTQFRVRSTVILGPSTQFQGRVYLRHFAGSFRNGSHVSPQHPNVDL